jgi:hypothetical protein
MRMTNGKTYGRPRSFKDGSCCRAARDVLAEQLQREGLNPGAAFAQAAGRVQRMDMQAVKRLVKRKVSTRGRGR